MSVLSCSNPNCDNIMCDYYVEQIGYVCERCKENFKDYASRSNISKEQIHLKLKVFMQSNYEYSDESIEKDIDEFFRLYEI